MKLQKLGSSLLMTLCLGIAVESAAQDTPAPTVNQDTSTQGTQNTPAQIGPQSAPAQSGNLPAQTVTQPPPARTGVQNNATILAPMQGTLSPVLVTEPVGAPITPDDRPLSGGQTIGIGTWGPRHSYIIPSLIVAESLDDNPLLLSTNNNGYRAFTNIGSTLLWRQFFGRDLEFRYSGAFRYDTRARLQGYDQFTHAHGFAGSKTIRSKNWRILLDDEAAYSQGSTFGNVGMEGMGTIGVLSQQLASFGNIQAPSTSLRPDIVPNQSILAERVSRFSNTALGEFDILLSPQNTATLAASYGLLHLDSSLLSDVTQASAVAGFNRKLSARDSIALEGAFSRFDFAHSNNYVSTEYVSAVYGRRITGRFAIEVGGGPQIIQSHASATPHDDVDWQGRASLIYEVGRVKLRASGGRSITGGAGALEGAITSLGQGAAEFNFTQRCSLAFSAGVSRNQQLDSPLRYDSQFTSIVFRRGVARFTDIYASYDLQHQTTTSACTGPLCNFTGLRNVFGIGLAWAHSPIGVR